MENVKFLFLWNAIGKNPHFHLLWLANCENLARSMHQRLGTYGATFQSIKSLTCAKWNGLLAVPSRCQLDYTWEEGIPILAEQNVCSMVLLSLPVSCQLLAMIAKELPS